MPKLWKKTRDTKDTANLEEVDLSMLAISSPTVIFISGRETTDKNLVNISKDLHFVKKILSDRPEIPSPPQVYAWSHGGLLSTLFNMASYDRLPHLSCRTSAKRLARGVIMPLVSADDQPLPRAEAQEKLRNLTLFGYCAGSVLAEELHTASMRMMKTIGYTSEEARSLLQEVVLVTIGTTSRPVQEKKRFTTLSLANSDDWFVRAKNFLHPYSRIFTKTYRHRQLTIKPLSETSLFVTGAASGRIRDRHKEPKEVIDGVRLRRWSIKNSNHEARDYVNNDDQHSQMSRIVSHALINAVSRKTLLKPADLLEPPASLPADEKALYERKIAQAKSAPKQRATL